MEAIDGAKQLIIYDKKAITALMVGEGKRVELSLEDVSIIYTYCRYLIQVDSDIFSILEKY